MFFSFLSSSSPRFSRLPVRQRTAVRAVTAHFRRIHLIIFLLK
ncbi:hypothetical protein BRYFOR_06784 [Marvinbryantia formatexigens DSM 14469]|uniref:Uncharacterized protein n=1 Tax=Marvinbryantia formatexigens DSM 14469 TaxID=478749 RepID=C6LDT4_9FIRM|nr:hypothetical protein BRYFOR_06784 [Marvinbryantia formatexigens DSM 14469]